MSQFLLVMNGKHDAWDSIGAEEKQRIMEKYYSFVNRLKREDRFKGGNALKHGGIGLRADHGLIITDGPFAESKEALNGYFLFEAKDLDEAVSIARDCPALTHGENVQVFEVGSHG